MPLQITAKFSLHRPSPPKKEMPATYPCSVCNALFTSRSDQKNHYRRECESTIKLTNLEGFTKTVERRDGKFACPECNANYSRTNNLASHWKKCLTEPRNKGIPRNCKTLTQ